MSSLKFGYARISTRDQDTGFQREALLKAGVQPKDLFEEQESGAKRDRPILADVLSRLREGDTLVVWKFDRIARSAHHLLTIVDDLKARGVNFISLTEAVDISTPWGKMVLTVLAGVAEMERSMIEERREAGIAKARADGVKFGRKTLDDPDSTAGKAGVLAQAILAVQGGMSLSAAARKFKLGRQTIKRHLGGDYERLVSSGVLSGKRGGKQPSNAVH